MSVLITTLLAYVLSLAALTGPDTGVWIVRGMLIYACVIVHIQGTSIG